MTLLNGLSNGGILTKRVHGAEGLKGGEPSGLHDDLVFSSIQYVLGTLWIVYACYERPLRYRSGVAHVAGARECSMILHLSSDAHRGLAHFHRRLC